MKLNGCGKQQDLRSKTSYPRALRAGQNAEIPNRAGEVEVQASRQLRIFCDADVLIAGSASTTGASHILLQLAELTLVTCQTSEYAIAEAERNLLAKLPAALAPFRLIVHAAITIVPPPTRALVKSLADQAHAKDVPILAAAVANTSDFLVTFNLRHFRPRKIAPLIQRPGELMAQVRRSLIHLLN